MTIMKCSSVSGRNLRAICISILSYFIVLTLLCQRVEGYSIAKHMEVDNIEHNCPELDNCNYGIRTGLLSPTIESSCACDIECSKFGDCCIDAPKSGGEKNDMQCYDVKGLGGVYMIGKCPTKYNGAESWRELCENTEIPDQSDPMSSVPVTDPDTGVTYKNIYCKLCNGKFYYMRFWKTKLECPFLSFFNESYSITEDYVLENLVEKEGNWGLNLEIMDGVFFLECNIETVFPSDFQNRIRRCKPNLISDCPSSRENEIIREKCKSFQGPRFTEGGEGYRNIYCAMCNNVNTAELSCADSLNLWRFETPAFALLLDVNVKKGERVGMVRLCKFGGFFDPFFKKCRKLQCLPGFVRRGRKCFPRRSVSKNVRKPAKSRIVYASSTNKPNTSISSTISNTSESTSIKTFSYTKKQSASYYKTSMYTTFVPPVSTEYPVYIHDSSDASSTEANLNKWL